MNQINALTNYCTGCGLCGSIESVGFKEDEKGFLYPELKDSNLPLCMKVCPASGEALKHSDRVTVWGRNIEMGIGWSKDESIRQGASSGGAITAICKLLLEQKQVDGIIHTASDPNVPYKTITQISDTTEAILQKMGSRYSCSMPLLHIRELLQPGKKYVFVGKPCDVSALRSYCQIDPQMKDQIKYFLSFFCAGVPSDHASQKLIEKLGGTKDNPCVALQYRGNGWPGYATAELSDGTKNSITYDESWGMILGRDVRRSCRFCMDGTGESADIAFGDAWYMKPDKTPDFSEAEGRNAVLVRTEVGKQLLNYAIEQNAIQYNQSDELEKELPYIQKYQFERKSTMYSMVSAVRLIGKPAPLYSRKILWSYAKHFPKKILLRRFVGMVKRGLNGKI